MAIFEKLVGVPGVIIIVLVGVFVGALVILRMICEKEAESYRKAVLADLKEPKETCTLEPAEPRRAQSMYTRSAKVIVQLNNWATHARNSDGDFDCVLPDMKMTVDFIGIWDSKEKMDSDFSACIKKLTETYQAQISGNLLSGGNEHGGYDGHEDRE